MKNKTLLFILITFILLLNACSPFTIATSSGEQPTPVVATEPPSTAYRPVQVDQVEAEVGVGSPIPIFVNVTGTLPDTCAQIELMQHQHVGSNFKITLSTVPSSAEACVQDTLPFRISIPLNVTNIPAGEYSVEVNGLQTSFNLETGNTTSLLPTADSVITKDDIEVEAVNVEIGVGSPIPVHAIAEMNLPGTCAQLGEMRMHREGNTFFVWLIADVSERADCIVDSIPFQLEIPLNIVNLPEGPYEVNINGTTASFDPAATPVSDNPLITLERTACFGACPIYTIGIYEDGRVEYVGQDFVAVRGEQNGSITPEQFIDLLAAFEKADYFNLQDEYTAPATDLPTTITSFTFEGKTKTVRNYGGCFSEILNRAPQALCDLEIMIDEITNSAQWVGNS